MFGYPLFRILGIIISGICAFALTACSDAQAVEPSLQVTITVPQPQVHTKTQATLPIATPLLTATSTQTAVPVFQICSPLAVHGLQELREIVSDPYRPPPPGKDMRHHGVDFSYYRHGDRTTIQGIEVQSVLPGRVAASLTETFPFGNLVIIETSSEYLPEELRSALGITPQRSLYLMYAHMESSPEVMLGQNVSACQPIGKVGKSGNAVEPHLHLETRTGPPGAVFQSMGYYQADHTEQEKANYLLWRTSGTYQHFDPMWLLNWGLGTPIPK